MPINPSGPKPGWKTNHQTRAQAIAILDGLGEDLYIEIVREINARQSRTRQRNKAAKAARAAAQETGE